MNRKQTLASLALAAMMAVGVASTAVAQNDSEATLQAGPGTNVCALTINGGAAFNFGIYTYDGSDYLQSGSRTSAVDFTVAVLTDDHPTDCSVAVRGTDLSFTTYAIPVGRVSLAQNGGTISVNPIAALTTSNQVLIPSVGGDPLGVGTANATATLTLTNADDVNAPGTYEGTITFTSTAAVP